MRFVRASELYDPRTGERIAHPDAGASDEEVSEAIDEIVTDGGRPVIRTERTCRFCRRSLRNEPYRCWYFGVCRICSRRFGEGSR
ncbi:hypothetical protein AArcCO_2917 [Halalkaliarchaeum sp. AArc-CO]|uniref:hypothetical protein n=1 Tax=unclassified Halalkaliarchaeum TaxID=2678344 RepID=UPI00217E4A12|nr:MULTISPECIES: hypothetical protein [unclassified Halalkaliarchaeum]MDR5674374.1 hypothetical protein [Halalkaliarchaeum sp. AArc-GB]UWG52189.1 hypothetical protein AArcCO_2917 [Halalkaliarchaeum sp. AArc-CO]